MLGICMSYESEYDPHSIDCWDMLFCATKPDKIYMMNLPENHYWQGHKYIKSLKENFIQIETYSEIQESANNCAFLSPKSSRYMPGNINLKNFLHPENCTYIFGPDIDHINDEIPGERIYIETKSDQQYFSWVAASITIFDRFSKNGC